MATIINSTPWTSQPQQAVGIDWGNPITRGLVAHEVGTKQPSGTQSIVTSLGKSLQASSSSSGGSVIQNPYSGNNLTVLVVAAPPSTGSNEYIFDGETGTDRDLLARIGSTGNYIWYVAGTEIADSSPLSSSLFDSHGSVVVLRSTQSAQSVFKNGSLFASRSASLATGASRRLRICSRYSSAEGMVSGGVSLLVIFNRALSDSEIRSLSQNPWQIFKPLPRRIFVPAPTASGLYTLTAQAGSYAVSGQQATLLRHRNLTANAGTYNITGQSVNITYSPTAAVYTLTAQAGSYSITGLPAQLSRHRNLITQSGSYVYTGFSAAISRTTLVPVYTLTALSGSYNIGGQSASILKHRVLSASAGAYVYIGQSININKYTPGSTTLVKYLNVLTGEVLILKPI